MPSCPSQPLLISASRRTDIPTFYGAWLRERLRNGWCEVENPFSGQVRRVSLAPCDVQAWVFWSRHYAPAYDVLERLHAGGLRFLCHFTITGFPQVLEPRTPPADLAVATARRLAADFGPDTVQWRYDPILLTSNPPPEWHVTNFRALCRTLEGHTRRCLFSFPTLYRKTLRNLGRLEASDALRVWSPARGDFTRSDLAALLAELRTIASSHGIALHACCCEPWVCEQPGIEAARCIDWPLLESLGAGEHLGRMAGCSSHGPKDSLAPPEDLFGPTGPTFSLKRRPTRPGCGCYQSVDIGAYHTCAHGCAYCYAVEDPAAAVEAVRRQNIESPVLGTASSRTQDGEEKDRC